MLFSFAFFVVQPFCEIGCLVILGCQFVLVCGKTHQYVSVSGGVKLEFVLFDLKICDSINCKGKKYLKKIDEYQFGIRSIRLQL